MKIRFPNRAESQALIFRWITNYLPVDQFSFNENLKFFQSFYAMCSMSTAHVEFVRYVPTDFIEMRKTRKIVNKIEIYIFR